MSTLLGDAAGQHDPRYDSYSRGPPSFDYVPQSRINGAGGTANRTAGDGAISYLSYDPNRVTGGGGAEYGQSEPTPAVATALTKFCTFIYNHENGHVLNRSPIELAKILIFYFVFYSALLALFSLCFLVVAYLVLNDDQPLRTGDQSLLKLQPGVGMRPIPDWRTTLIRFEMGKEQTFQMYTQNMQAYIDQYENFAQLEQPDVRQTKCDIRTGFRENKDLRSVCKFNLEELGACNKESMYGYARGQPCVIIKMNKIYGWLPDPDNIVTQNGTNKDILVDCYGVHDADRDFLNHVKYYPSKRVNGREYGFFSHTFYPYLVQAGYLPPIVMAQFTNMTKNRLTMVECRLLGIKNMVYNPMRRLGSVRFEIVMD